MQKLHIALGTTIAFACAGLSAQVQTLYTVNGDFAYEYLGHSVRGAGDVDGDGYDDFIAGAPGDSNNGSYSGSARVYSGRTGSTLYTFSGDSAYDYLGQFAVNGAGDVNGDGYHDLIVGAYGDDNSGTDAGSAKVYSGKTGTVLYTFNGDSAYDYFGYVVDGAGDVNCDGFDDLIVGAPQDDNNGTNSGSAKVYSGKTGAALYTLNGDAQGDVLGRFVSGAGDVNRDGFADFIVGASGDDNSSGVDAGCAKVYSGRTGTVLYTFLGDSAYDYFGISACGAGDVNDDGYDDLIVGALRDDNNGTDSGSARVFSGQNGTTLYTFYGDSAYDLFGYSADGAGDVDGDGYDDLIVGAQEDDNNGSKSGSARVISGRTGTTLHTFNGDAAGDYLGYSVSGAGDVNGDGYHDLVVGIPEDDNKGTQSGSVRIYSLGLTGTPPRMRGVGHACPGSNGNLPRIDYRGRLALNDTIDFLLRGAAPNAVCAMILANPTEFDFGSILPGLPGCMQYAELDFLWVWGMTDINGMASINQVRIPNNPNLVGLPINAQWGCQDAGANPFGATTSNGLEMVFGN